MLSNQCVYCHYIVKAIITVHISKLQALGDLIVHILFYNDHQEHELECKEKIYYTAAG